MGVVAVIGLIEPVLPQILLLLTCILSHFVVSVFVSNFSTLDPLMQLRLTRNLPEVYRLAHVDHSIRSLDHGIIEGLLHLGSLLLLLLHEHYAPGRLPGRVDRVELMRTGPSSQWVLLRDKLAFRADSANGHLLVLVGIELALRNQGGS